MKTDPRATAGRAFVRSLNILLKFARLYGYDHVRTAEQLKIAWNELQTAIPEGSESGLLLGATGTQLLLDGVPLEGKPAEKQFAQLLSAAGLASIQFHPCVTEDELERFTRAFPTGKAKPVELAQQMKEALAGARGIHVNEVCFVATDARLKDASMAAQIAAASLGDSQDSFRKMLNDPQKLLELIAAAEGSKGGGAGEGLGIGGGGSGSGGLDDGEGIGGGTGNGMGVGTLEAGETSGGGYGAPGARGPRAGSGAATAGDGTGDVGSSGVGSGGGGGYGGTGTEPGLVGSGEGVIGIGRGVHGEAGTGGNGHGVGMGATFGPGGREGGSGAASNGRATGAGPGTGSGAGGGVGMGPGPGGTFAGTGVGPGASGTSVGAGAGGGGTGGGNGFGRGRGGSGGGGFGGGFPGGRMGAGGFGNEPSDQQILGILRALTAFGKVGTTQNVAAATVEFQDHVNSLPPTSQNLLRNALAEMAEQGKNKKLDQGVLVQLAEHLSIRFALEQFERGEVKVNAVKQMLDRLNQEIEQLRQILGQHEDKMTEAGLMVESHREILDRQFWANIPESAKREVLLSNEAWCIPPKNVQSYVSDLIAHGDIADAASILENYASCADSEDPAARKRAATGLSELAELYAKMNPRLLAEALRHVGLRLNVEQDQDLQSLVSAAFVRLCQEAAAKRHFGAMAQALDLLAGVETQRPGIARTLRVKMGIEERVPEFVEEALRARQISAGLTGVLKQLPQTAMEQLAVRFNRCQYREDIENVANFAHDLGEEALQHLRSTVRGGALAEAVEMVGLLVRLDPTAAGVFLPSRIREFPRAAQDRIVRQISASGAAGRVRILLAVLDFVDPMIMPLVVDEAGMTEDREALGRMLTLADGDLPAGAAPYLRVKAIEALGRLKAPESGNALKRILEARKLFGWAHPQEMRIAAVQALEKLEPEWVKEFLPVSGIEPEDLRLAPLETPENPKFVRNRRHTRVKLQKPISAVSTNLKQNCHLDIRTASLSGGIATTSMHLAPGTQVSLKMQLGLRNLQATALMRDYRAQDMAFEFVDISMDERGKLRKLLLENMGKAV